MDWIVCIYCGQMVYFDDSPSPKSKWCSAYHHDCFRERFTRKQIEAIETYLKDLSGYKKDEVNKSLFSTGET